MTEWTAKVARRSIVGVVGTVPSLDTHGKKLILIPTRPCVASSGSRARSLFQRYIRGGCGRLSGQEGELKAIVVDDSRAMRGLLGRILKEIGFEIREAANGAEALEKLRSGERIDLALVDCNMPEMDGFELVRNVRADRAFDSLRVLMVTTECEIDKVEIALQAGVDDYIMKPFTREVITEKIAMLELEPSLPIV